MKALLFILLFVGLVLVVAGFLMRGPQASNSWQGFMAAGMALETISIGLLLWNFVVKPQFRKG